MTLASFEMVRIIRPQNKGTLKAGTGVASQMYDPVDKYKAHLKETAASVRPY